MKSSSISQLARPHLQNLRSYQTARHDFQGQAIQFMDANESPEDTGFNRYPDPWAKDLREAIATREALTKDQVLIANGSDELIDLLMRAFVEPGREEVAILGPTYGMYKIWADINAIKQKVFRLNKAFNLDQEIADQILTQETKLLFLCSPNNPSGNLLEPEWIYYLLDRYKGLVVIDEAYWEFCKTQSWSQALKDYPRLIVLRTFSKAYAGAGLRMGYMLANQEAVRIIDRIKAPYNTGLFNQKKALSLYKDPKIKGSIAELLQERVRLAEALSNCKRCFKVWPSDANFILFQWRDYKRLMQSLSEAGIIIRDRSGILPEALRVSIGARIENQRLIELIQKEDAKTVVYR